MRTYGHNDMNLIHAPMQRENESMLSVEHENGDPIGEAEETSSSHSISDQAPKTSPLQDFFKGLKSNE
jgi:hypothetical protein